MPASEASGAACGVCELLEGTPVGGWVYEDELWAASIYPSRAVPGWIVLWLRRHAEAMTSLTAQEASSFGPLAVKLSHAIETTMDTERVYLQVYGEQNRHWHCLFSARPSTVVPEHRAWRFLEHSDQYTDVEAASAAAAAIRSALALP